jgi:hypothetical protein
MRPWLLFHKAVALCNLRVLANVRSRNTTYIMYCSLDLAAQQLRKV